MHSIHGRAPAIASGLKATRKELSVWIITGEGDSMSIGGNHLIHALRRNFDVNILLFNNEIYGLTKGQYSPLSPEGRKTKSSPMGSIDHPFNPLALAQGADASFIARSIDRSPKHMRDILLQSHQHKGTSLLEIFQNCNIFNDGAFSQYTENKLVNDSVIFVEDGKPMVFWEGDKKGIRLDGLNPVVVDLEADNYSIDDLWVHDKSNRIMSTMLTRIFNNAENKGNLPLPFGVLYAESRPTYEVSMSEQIEQAIREKGKGDLNDLLRGENTWVVD